MKVRRSRWAHNDGRERDPTALKGPILTPLLRRSAQLGAMAQAAAGIALRQAARRLSLTRLWAVASKYPARPVRSRPRQRVRRKPPTDFIQPKISSTRFLMRWLTA